MGVSLFETKMGLLILTTAEPTAFGNRRGAGVSSLKSSQGRLPFSDDVTRALLVSRVSLQIRDSAKRHCGAI